MKTYHLCVVILQASYSIIQEDSFIQKSLDLGAKNVSVCSVLSGSLQPHGL